MLCPDSDIAPSSNCQYWWTPSSIGRSHISPEAIRGTANASVKAVLYAGNTAALTGLSLCYVHSILHFSINHGLCCDDGGCLCLPDEWTSCLAHQTHTLALVLKSCHITTTVPVIAVHIARRQSKWFYFQRDTEWCLSPWAARKNQAFQASGPFSERVGSK